MTEEQPPVSPIPLPSDAIKSLAEGQQKLAEVQGQINSFIAGLRLGMSVPDGWQLDLQKRAFVPPQRHAAE